MTYEVLIERCVRLCEVESVAAMHEHDVQLLEEAHELGVGDDDFLAIIRADRVSRTDTIVLPKGSLEDLSRGRGWCRQGSGADVVWGERVDGGYRVGPGRWSVGSTDGFKRKRARDWKVAHITVGEATWTLAFAGMGKD